jgi:hypothetical protein
MLTMELPPRPTGLAPLWQGGAGFPVTACRPRIAAPRVLGHQGSYQLVHRYQWVNVDTTKEELIQ